MHLPIPSLSLVVLTGPSGSGKTTFARRHFLPTEVLSSDYCRGLVSDNENDQRATVDAFEALHFIAAKRLAAERLTVVDATNVQPESRRPFIELARKFHCLPVAIVFDLPETLCQERNRGRDDRMFGPHVVRQQRSQLRRSLKSLKREGFRHVFVMKTPEQVESATIERAALWNGKLVVAHAGMKQEMQGRGSGKVRDFALYGETTGETDEFGLPIRFDWAADYRGSARVVYGHTPVPEPEWLNRTVNIDTGCVFGGKLTALRYPEREFVSVEAKATYCAPSRPFLPQDQQAIGLSLQHRHDDVLDADDVIGKRIIATRLRGNITVREENATAALEVMSRFAANPKWLIWASPSWLTCELRPYSMTGCRRIDGACVSNRLFSLPIRLFDEHAVFKECIG